MIIFSAARDRIEYVGHDLIEDVTSDALKAVIEFIGIGETRVVTVDGRPVLALSVQTVEEGKCT